MRPIPALPRLPPKQVHSGAFGFVHKENPGAGPGFSG